MQKLLQPNFGRALAGALLLSSAFSLAMAAETSGFTGLRQSWEASLKNDPAFAAIEARHETSRSKLTEARALWLPTLSAQGGIGHGDQQSETRGAAFSTPTLPETRGVNFLTQMDTSTRSHWSFEARQPLLDNDRRIDASGLKNAANQAEVQYLDARQQQILKVAEAWIGAINAANDLSAVQRLIAAADRAGGLAQARYDAGELPITDLRDAQALRDTTAVRLLDARNALDVAQLKFTHLTGLQPPTALPLPDVTPHGLALEERFELWQQRAQQSSPQLILQTLRSAQADSEVSRHGVLAGAQVSVVAITGRNLATGSGSYGRSAQESQDSLLGLEAHIPLFTGGMRSAQRNEARALARAASADLQSVRQQLDEQLHAAWLRLTTAEARRKALARAASSAAMRLDATRIGLEAGDRTTLDVLTAESDQLRLDAERQRAALDLLLADLNLRAVTGTLSPETFEHFDDWLTPSIAAH